MTNSGDTMTLKKAIAGQIRAKRETAGISQDKLAAKAGVSTRYYQSIEAADKQPSLDTVFKLAIALDCDYTELLQPAWAFWRDDTKG